MPMTCVACNCKNRFKKGAGISFHRFPFRNKELLAAWVQAVKRGQWRPNRASSLCSNHFESKWFYDTNEKRKLLNLAVPTIFDFSNNISSRRKRKYSTPAHLAEDDRYSKSTAKQSNLSSSTEPSQKYPKRGKVQKQSEPFGESPTMFVSSVVCKPSTTDLDDGISETLVLNSRKKKHLHQVREETPTNKKIKSNDVHSVSTDSHLNVVANAEISAQDFEEIMRELKLRLKSNQGAMIIEACFGDVIKGILRNPHNKVTEYSKSVKRLASTVHFYSVEAYDYLRSKAKFPHPSTLFHWATVPGGKPGFTDESFLHIAKQVKAASLGTDICGNQGHIYCCLVIDEMQLEKQLDFDGKDIIGYCDLGHGDLSNDEVPVAKEALVFMANAINRNWKLPLGYCFIDGLESSVRANLVRMYLRKLNEVGVKCVAVACDGAVHNLRMFSELGIELNSISRKNWFAHPSDPEKRVYSFFDVAYMIKMLRNLIGEKGVIIDSSKEEGDNKIEWRFFKNLHILQEQVRGLQKPDQNTHQGDLSGGKKMKEVFIRKMKKYNLTEDSLSGSVSLALRFCQRLNLVEFQGSSTTAEFASKVDDIFDLLNSSYVSDCGNKSPILKKNKQIILNRISEAIHYLEGLKEQRPGELCQVTNGQRKVGILGLIFDLMSVRDLTQQLVWGDSFPLASLLTETLSQGHMETFFANIRKHAGGISNLTALEFRAAYNKCMLESVCVPSKSTRMSYTGS